MDPSPNISQNRQNYLWLLDQALENNEHLLSKEKILEQCQHIESQMKIRKQQLQKESQFLFQQGKLEQWDKAQVKISNCERPLNDLFTSLIAIPAKKQKTSAMTKYW